MLFTGIAPANAQFRTLWSPEKVARNHTVNLFAQWEGRTVLDGVWLELPPGWRLLQGEAIRRGVERVPLRINAVNGSPNTYRVQTTTGPLGAHDLIFRVSTGGHNGELEWALTPLMLQQDRDQPRLVRRETYRASRRLIQDEAMPLGENRALSFNSSEATPVQVKREVVPDLNPRAGYTIEVWIKTLQTEGIILSTWDGNEDNPYPLELVVDPAGRLVYYRGQPGHHQSMRAVQPVADGKWHHIAIAHNGASGWSRLLVDGVAMDSLFAPVPQVFSWETPLVLGGRVTASGTSASSPNVATFNGMLDELRVWPTARSQQEIRRSMHQPIEEVGGGLVLHFDAPMPGNLLVHGAEPLRTTPADLTFYFPIRHLQAAEEEETQAVLLSWDTRDVHTEAFIIERSVDGTSFIPVGEVAGPRRENRGSEASYYTFLDSESRDQVVFYRIRQRFQGGSERLSGTIKLGRGPVPAESTLLVGNFPNPFVRVTTIGYEVRKLEQVHISVWDLSGQQVASLVSREHEPGYYRVQFEGDDLPSGTYFVRLQTPSGTQTRKMILAK